MNLSPVIIYFHTIVLTICVKRSHGWEHVDVSKIRDDESKLIIGRNIKLLQTHPRYVPYHAYTWGRHTEETGAILLSKDITPVYIDGMKNYNEQTKIHRELL